MTTLSAEACRKAARGDFSISLEVFPARTEKGRQNLCALARRLAAFSPRFISVTYGAGGSSREATLETIAALIGDDAGIPVAGHLTCSDASREETMQVAEQYVEMGVMRIVALRGDPAEGQERFEPHPRGFSRAAELVAALRQASADSVVMGGPRLS